MPCSDLDIDGGAPSLGVNALHHGLDLLHRPNFIKVCDSIFDHCSDAWLPQHRAGQLLLEKVYNNSWVRTWFDRLGGSIHEDLELWWLHFWQHTIQSFAQFFLRWLHQWRVKATSCLEQFRLQCTCFFCHFLQSFNGLLRPSTRKPFWEKLVGNLANGIRTFFFFLPRHTAPVAWLCQYPQLTAWPAYQ